MEFWDEPEGLALDELGPVFTATYESDSACCGDIIAPGEDARADGRGGWIHADDSCEAIARGTDRATGHTAISAVGCSRCLTVHAGECA